MKNLKLTIEMLPKGAWENDLSRTLSKKDWDTLREFCYKKANNTCQICGEKTSDLNAHEVWEFNEKNKTQTLKNIIAICNNCHGVKHFKNSVRLGYGDLAKFHFMQVNQCSEMDFAECLNQALFDYKQRNKIFRWKMIADLSKFGGKDIKLESTNVPLITSSYENIDFIAIPYQEIKNVFQITSDDSLIGAPKIYKIYVNNYQGIVCVKSLFTNKIEWFLDGKKIKTMYNTAGSFSSELQVAGLNGSILYFKLTNNHGTVLSRNFILTNQKT